MFYDNFEDDHMKTLVMSLQENEGIKSTDTRCFICGVSVTPEAVRRSIL